MSKEEIEEYLRQKGYALEDGDSYLVNDIDDLLDKQFAELKAENERLKDNNKSKLVELFNEENKKLKQQLKEKDELYNASQLVLEDNYRKQLEQKDNKIAELELRIDQLMFDYKVTENEFYKYQTQKSLADAVTKQVCEKIRELAKNDFEFVICDECYNTVDKDVYISSVVLTQILDQIEKGE